MVRFKSYIYFLIFLILSQPVFHGCTVGGYATGRNSEIRNANTYRKIQVTELKEGDIVDLILKDNSALRCEIIFINVNEKIGVCDVETIAKTKQKTEVVTYTWEEISDIKALEIKKELRYGLAAMGLAFDCIIVLVAVLTVKPNDNE